MPQVIREGKIKFEFSDDWLVCKLDDHSVYRSGLEKLKGSSAVDFICCLPGRKISFVEIKDYRGHGIESKKKFKSGLWIKMAQKVRDSVALIAAARRRSLAGDWTTFAETLSDKGNRLNALLWIEADPAYRVPKRQRQQGMSKLDSYLSWLKPKTAVIASDRPSGAQYGLVQHDLL